MLDPAPSIEALRKNAAARITHVHLKEVRLPMAHKVQRGELSYTDAVRAGILEQDTILVDEPGSGEGPRSDVRRSLEFITNVTHP